MISPCSACLVVCLHNIVGLAPSRWLWVFHVEWIYLHRVRTRALELGELDDDIRQDAFNRLSTLRPGAMVRDPSALRLGKIQEVRT